MRLDEPLRAGVKRKAGLTAALAAVGVALVTVAAFLPVLGNGFVDWDDEPMFGANVHYRGLGARQLAWMWTTFHLGQYRPLTWITYGIDYLVWGLWPAGYHATSLGLHAVNAVLVFVLARRLLAAGGVPAPAVGAGAAIAALGWALHPLRVEPVAWASARGDLLAATFCLATVLVYVGAIEDDLRRRRRLALALGLFAASLAAKPSAVVLPLVLLVLDVHPLARLGPGRWRSPAARAVWEEKLLFAAVAVPALALALSAKTEPMIAAARYAPVVRVSMTVHGAAFALGKMLLPLRLSPLYEIPVDPAPWAPRIVAAAGIVIALTVTLVVVRRRWPGPLAAWLTWLALLLPSGGVVPFGRQMTADRYTYLAAIGWALVAGGAVASLGAGRARRWGAALVAGVVLAIATLGTLTWRQAHVWRDAESLWTQALAADEGAAVAHNNLGVIRGREGRLDEAIAHFRGARARDPGYAEARYNWGVALARERRWEESIEKFRETLALRHDYADAENDWGLALVEQGRPEEAIPHFEAALRIDPALATPHSNWGLALVNEGKLEEAIAHLTRALQLQPDHPQARFNRAFALLRLGRRQEAEADFQRAIEIDPSLRHRREGIAPERR